MNRVFAPGDPRARRPGLEPVPWHRDRGVLGAILGFVGVAALVLGVVFVDQLYQFVSGVDLESRYGRCSADSTGDCATVESGTIGAVNGDTLTIQQAGFTYTVVRASGAQAASFSAGEAIETESVGGPVGEVKAGNNLLFTRYYVPQNPFYAQWQGAVFGGLAGFWLIAYLWAMLAAGVRNPLQLIRRE